VESRRDGEDGSFCAASRTIVCERTPEGARSWWLKGLFLEAPVGLKTMYVTLEFRGSRSENPPAAAQGSGLMLIFDARGGDPSRTSADQLSAAGAFRLTGSLKGTSSASPGGTAVTIQGQPGQTYRSTSEDLPVRVYQWVETQGGQSVHWKAMHAEVKYTQQEGLQILNSLLNR
jgi:hypothetical protein